MIDYAGAATADLPQIRDLLHASDLPTDDLSAKLLAHFRTARAKGQLVGCVGLEPLDGRIALLRSLAVKADHRDLGVASRLCEDIEEHARGAGIVTLYLLTTTASGYFTTRGYSPIDRDALPASVRATAEFRQLCPATAVAMKKDLKIGV